MTPIDYEKMQKLFEKYSVEWCININISSSKTLEYSPLHDELSFDSSENINTSITIIKNHKKSVFSLDWYSLDKIDASINEMLKTIDFWQYDEDIILPKITDIVEKDFSNWDLDVLSFQDLEKEFQVFKNFPFEKNISKEWFSIGTHSATHIFMNSFGAKKIQKDNGAFYYVDIFWENGGKRENHYDYISTKNIPHITWEMLEKLQKELLFKISDSEAKVESGKYDITLERDVVCDFLDIILGNMWAEGIREWISLFSKNKLWDKIFGANFTLINNPELKNYTGTMLFDKEWMTAKKTILFDKWVFSSKFYDYKNTLKEWVWEVWNSTISNIELVWDSDANYLEGSKILFTNLMAFHTVDEATGKFSLNGEWYLLENGEKVDYIKNISLSGNVLDLFSNIKAIGNDFKEDGNFRVPSLTFYNQNII